MGKHSSQNIISFGRKCPLHNIFNNCIAKSEIAIFVCAYTCDLSSHFITLMLYIASVVIPTSNLAPSSEISETSETSDDSNGGVVAIGLGAVLAALAIALVVSITINVLLCIQRKNSRLFYIIDRCIDTYVIMPIAARIFASIVPSAIFKG